MQISQTHQLTNLDFYTYFDTAGHKFVSHLHQLNNAGREWPIECQSGDSPELNALIRGGLL